ncbi:inorganic phosphate transporter [Polaromonas sp. P2-4]|nr:inorganic phosphate transporter [Polaromonas sp. P2-4]
MDYLLIAVALFLAFGNGANDNFKGFATVWGSESLSYRQALILATLATLAGSLLSLYLAHGLVQQFSGKGLLPPLVVDTPRFIASVGLGAALTVIIATRAGLPISTTHALLGGLVGAGLAASPGELQLARPRQHLCAAPAPEPGAGRRAGLDRLPSPAAAARRNGLRLRSPGAAGCRAIPGDPAAPGRTPTDHRPRQAMRPAGGTPRPVGYPPPAGPPAYFFCQPDLFCAR